MSGYVNGHGDNAAVYRTRDVARLLGVYQSDVERLIRSGELPATKDGRRWAIDPADVERHLRAQLGIAELISLRKLREEVAQQREDLEQERAVARNERFRAERGLLVSALESMSLELALTELAALDLEGLGWNDRQRVYDKAFRVQQAIDARDRPPVGERPVRVPANAKSQLLATGIGRISVWYWPTAKGWRAKAGGSTRTHTFWARTSREARNTAIGEARRMYGRPVRALSARTRFAVLKRDNFACRYCGQKAPGVVLHVDHVIPVASRGTSDESNLVTACDECNQGKADLE